MAAGTALNVAYATPSGLPGWMPPRPAWHEHSQAERNVVAHQLIADGHVFVTLSKPWLGAFSSEDRRQFDGHAPFGAAVPFVGARAFREPPPPSRSGEGLTSSKYVAEQSSNASFTRGGID